MSTPPMLAAIAREYQAGRRLYVVTTNLDAQRTTIWDMGKIAASGDPGALDLAGMRDKDAEVRRAAAKELGQLGARLDAAALPH